MTAPVLPALTIVIPAYNEELRLSRTLEIVSSYAVRQPESIEVIIVDDGSTDRTGQVIREFLGKHALWRGLQLDANRGKGFAVRAGVLEARAPVVLFMDADLAAPVEELEKLHARLAAGFDVVVGSRYRGGKRGQVQQTSSRWLAGRIFGTLVGFLGGRTVVDTQCGFKMFRRDAARSVFGPLQTSGFAFDVEILLRARRLGLRVAELQIRWRAEPGSRVRLFRDGFRMLWEVLRMRGGRLQGCSAAGLPRVRRY